MPIPDFQTLPLPLLTFAADGHEHNIREAINHLAEFGLTEHELKELLPSGADFVFENRVRWARTYPKESWPNGPTTHLTAEVMRLNR